jgi:hypothetical protein
MASKAPFMVVKLPAAVPAVAVKETCAITFVAHNDAMPTKKQVDKNRSLLPNHFVALCVGGEVQRFCVRIGYIKDC